jgi:hypothetical protein
VKRITFVSSGIVAAKSSEGEFSCVSGRTMTSIRETISSDGSEGGPLRSGAPPPKHPAASTEPVTRIAAYGIVRLIMCYRIS